MSNGFFQRLHQLVATGSTSTITEEHLRLTFDDREVGVLREKGVLTRSEVAPVIICPCCEDGHFAEVQTDDEGKLFVSCPKVSDGPYYPDPASINLWRPDRVAMMHVIADKLELEKDVREVVPGELWTVGVRKTANKTACAVLFSRTDDLSVILSAIERLPLGHANTVIFTPSGDPTASKKRHIRPSSLDKFVMIKTRGLGSNLAAFDEMVDLAFRRLAFTTDGDIFLDGKILGSLPVGTVEYWFFDGLMAHFGTWVSQADILKYCADAMDRASFEKTPQNFCADLKYRIKKMCGGSKIVDKMVVSGPFSGGKNGVRIIEPR